MHPTPAILIATAILAAAAPAQVPDGSYVTSSFEVGGFSGPAGVYLVDRGSGAVTAVTNLPPEITGAAYPGVTVFGTDFVVRRPSDGALITTGWGAGVTGVQLPLFLLTLTGNAVTTTVRYDLGLLASPTARGATQAHVLHDERIVVAVDQVGGAGEPLAGAVVGIVDPGMGPPGTPGTVTAITLAPVPPGAANGMAIDEAAGNVYLGMIQTGQPSEIWSAPLTGGAPTLVTTIAETITNMALANDGDVWVVCSGSGGIYRVDVGAGTAVPFTSLNNFNGAAVERTTGDLIVATGAPGPTLRRVTGGGVVTTIASAPSGGWGTLVGLDVNHDPEPFGAGTAGANSYRWAAAPNPGGVPRLGNAAFALTVTSAPGLANLSSIVATGNPAAGPLQILGLDVLLDPNSIISQFVGPGSATFTLPLAIPNDPNLVAVRLFFQSFHLEPGSVLASSNGLALTILP